MKCVQSHFAVHIELEQPVTTQQTVQLLFATELAKMIVIQQELNINMQMYT